MRLYFLVTTTCGGALGERQRLNEREIKFELWKGPRRQGDLGVGYETVFLSRVDRKV